jgi:hypothetical protein
MTVPFALIWAESLAELKKVVSHSRIARHTVQTRAEIVRDVGLSKDRESNRREGK